MNSSNTINASLTSFPSASKSLSLAASAWLVVTTIGQWIFVIYVAALYMPLLARLGLLGLEETHLPNGYVPGDLTGNLAISAHLAIAIIIIGLGPLQLMTPVRNRYPTFHRWAGRTYMTAALMTSLAGLYLVWTRGVVGGLPGHLAISLDGILIIIFGAIALRHAMARRIDKHRDWALRFFIVVSAVWFFRIGMMGWIVLTGGIGINFETFTGPFLTFWFFGQMFVPLAVLELYIRARESKNVKLKFVASVALSIATLVMMVGIGSATLGMWLPRI